MLKKYKTLIALRDSAYRIRSFINGNKGMFETIAMSVCSHVLEHVDNDIAAMKELRRIIRKNGCGIMTVHKY